MKFQLQENEVEIINLGDENNESRNVTFSVGGETFEREILMSADHPVANNLEEFHLQNRETIEKSVIDHLSENNMYNR